MTVSLVAGGVTITGLSSITVGVSTLVVVLVSRVSVSMGPLEVVTDEYVSALAAGAVKPVTAKVPNVKNNANFMESSSFYYFPLCSRLLDVGVREFCSNCSASANNSTAVGIELARFSSNQFSFANNPMLLFHQPSKTEIDLFISDQISESDQSTSPFTYTAIGATAGDDLPSGYNVDHHRAKLGTGSDAYERAKQAIRTWRMFDCPWLQLCWPDAPIEKDTVVAPIAKLFGFWSLNACKIVYVVDQPPNANGLAKFGFAYGTLAQHAESGEERFTVEFDQATQEVTYDVLAFSRPNQLLSQIGYPLARKLQKRFATDSMAAMLRAVQAPTK